jgi:uncharacterized membrane protein YqiK
MEKLEALMGYWWLVFPVIAIVGYKWTLRVLCGMVIIPEDKIGIVVKKFVLFGAEKTLPDGRIIALKGEAGVQADTLAPGLYWSYWVWQYDISQVAFTTIQPGNIGLLVARDGVELPMGHILARNVPCDNFQDTRAFLTNGGQKGKQVAYLQTGSYRINTLLFTIATIPVTTIAEGMVGIITAMDGVPLPSNQIAGLPIEGHNNFQDFDRFLENQGNRGLQPQVILAGSYALNLWAITIEQVEMTEIPIGNVGVVISYVGEEGKDISGTEFKHGNIVKKGDKGVWSTPYDPGKYPINTYIMKVVPVPTTNLVLNWATGRNESHKLDANLSTITVRSKDGFAYNLDVAQIIHIPSSEAPKVIARFGSMQNLVSQVLEPTIGNYFRNSAQDSDVISFLSTRQERQKAAKERISQVLEEYNVHAVDTLIGDIAPPPELMKTLTDRKIAFEEKQTFNTQQEAQEQKQKLKSATALADMQEEIVQATQSVIIAERNAEKVVKESAGEAKRIEAIATANAFSKKTNAEAAAKEIELVGAAEAGKIQAIGDANASAYEKQVKAMGPDNFSKFKIIEEVSKGKIKIIPEILINGGSGGGATEGILGMEILKMVRANTSGVADVKTETTVDKKEDKK